MTITFFFVAKTLGFHYNLCYLSYLLNLINFFMLTKEEVIKISQLVRIELSEAEVEKFQKELSTVLDYVEELKLVDVSGLEEVSQVTGLVNVQREDKVIDLGNREEILSEAPEIKDGYYKVKAIL